MRIPQTLCVGLVLASTLFGAGCRSSEPVSNTTTPQQARQKIYNIETAKIVSTIRGDFAHGTETRIFTNWGLTESVVWQKDGETSQGITITNATGSYAFATGDKQGLHSPIDPSVPWREDRGIDYETYLASRFKEQNFVASGTRIIAERSCTVWKHAVDPITFCVWNGLPLYLESHSADGKQTSIIEVTSIDERPVIAPHTFDIPNDIVFQEESELGL